MEKHFIVSGFDGTPEQLIRLLAKGFKRIEYNVDKKGNVILYYKTNHLGEPVLELDQPQHIMQNCKSKDDKQDKPKPRSIPKELAAAKIECERLNNSRFLERKRTTDKEHDDR